MSRRCRECDAPITWAQTENGRPMPLNVGPDPNGNVIVTGHTGACQIVKVGTIQELADAPEGRVYMSHFQTCTNPRRFRRGKLNRANNQPAQESAL